MLRPYLKPPDTTGLWWAWAVVVTGVPAIQGFLDAHIMWRLDVAVYEWWAKLMERETVICGWSMAPTEMPSQIIGDLYWVAADAASWSRWGQPVALAVLAVVACRNRASGWPYGLGLSTVALVMALDASTSILSRLSDPGAVQACPELFEPLPWQWYVMMLAPAVPVLIAGWAGRR